MGLKMSVAARLMNGESLAMGKDILRVEYIPRDKIHKNPKNSFYSKDGIEELARDIRMCGLEQPLVVYQKDDGEYMLLTGERRLTAIDSLMSEGRWEGEIPCIIRSLDEYNLPLDNDMKERFAILRTNAFNRKMTDADIMQQALEYREIVLALKKAGYKEFTVGYDEEGNPITKNIGGRVREAVADLVGVSTGQIGKVEYIEKHGSEETKEAVLSGKLGISDGARIASLPEDKQTDAINSSGTKNNETKPKKNKTLPRQETEIASVQEDACATNGTNEEEWDNDSAAFPAAYFPSYSRQDVKRVLKNVREDLREIENEANHANTDIKDGMEEIIQTKKIIVDALLYYITMQGDPVFF